MISVWIQFFVSAVIIIVGGSRLCFYSDVISERSGLSRAWIGMVLLGIVTSLPEAGTTLASVARIDAPDLATGNVLGSNIFNLMIIAVLDFTYRGGSITSSARARNSHVLSGAFILILSSLVIAGIVMAPLLKDYGIYNIGPASLLIGLVYLAGMRLIFNFQKKEGLIEETQGRPADGRPSLRQASLGFLAAAVLVIMSAVWLADSGEKIAQLTGLGRTFVGTIFLAAVTSFPELVVSIAAVRLGAVDLAFGNIFGSNMVNLFIIPIADAVYRKGDILSAVSHTHIFTAAAGMSLTCVAMAGLMKRKKKTYLGLSWDTFIMTAGYAAGMYILYRLRG